MNRIFRKFHLYNYKFSILRVTRTPKSLDEFEFPPISTTDYTELAALECLHFSVAVYVVVFEVADKEEMHNILDDFKFWPDWTKDNRVSCP